MLHVNCVRGAVWCAVLQMAVLLMMSGTGADICNRFGAGVLVWLTRVLVLLSLCCVCFQTGKLRSLYTPGHIMQIDPLHTFGTRTWSRKA